MKIKISQFIPLVGTIGGLGLLILIGSDKFAFTLDPNYIWAFMSITMGSTVAHKTVKKWRT